MKNVFVITLLLSLSLFLLVACAEPERQIVDPEGNEVTLVGTPQKILSSAPSNTKILLSLGLADRIVGISKYDDDYEELAEDILRVDFKSPDAEAILALEPDLIIASGHNKTGDEDPFRLLKEAGIAVVYLPSANSIERIYEDVTFIADITGTVDKGEEVNEAMAKEMEKIETIASGIEKPKKVYLEIAPAPNIYTTGAGTFQHELIETIGATNIFADESGWFSPSAEQVLSKDPEVIVTTVSYVDDAVGELYSREGFDALEAIKNEQVYLLGGSVASQPAPSTVVEALWRLGAFVYPEHFEDQ